MVARAAAGFHIARETFDVGPADLEQPLVALLAQAVNWRRSRA